MVQKDKIFRVDFRRNGKRDFNGNGQFPALRLYFFAVLVRQTHGKPDRVVIRRREFLLFSRLVDFQRDFLSRVHVQPRADYRNIPRQKQFGKFLGNGHFRLCAREFFQTLNLPGGGGVVLIRRHSPPQRVDADLPHSLDRFLLIFRRGIRAHGGDNCRQRVAFGGKIALTAHIGPWTGRKRGNITAQSADLEGIPARAVFRQHFFRYLHGNAVG